MARTLRRPARLRLCPLEQRTTPATFTVNSLADAGVGTGTTGDLRYCINQANDELSFPGLDTITFAVTGTITLTSGELAVTAPLVVNGPGADKLTVSGNKASRHFNVFDGDVTVLSLSLSGLTLTDGFASGASAPGGAGGAIYAQKLTALTLVDCTISNNVASIRGGGIYCYGYAALTVRGSTISGNKANAGNGGGIYTYGAPTVLIENSTISGNSATVSGGGINVGYWIAPGAFTMRNSTVVGNSAASTSGTGGGGGIRVSSGTSTAPNLTIISSVVSGNSNPANAPDIRAKVVDLSNSAVGSTAGFALGVNTANLVGASLNLGPLAANGGPTATHLPGPNSPLRNAGANPAAFATDQRGAGFPRVLEGVPDIGAVESPDPSPQRKLVPVPPIAVPGPTPNTVSVTYSDAQSGINVATIDVNDVKILAPDGLTLLPIAAATVDVNTNGTPRVATYSFAPPGGSWDGTDAGTYTVVMNANQVFDLDTPTPAAAAAGTIGTFSVTIPSVYVVNATNDEATDTDGKTSLREALALANKAPNTLDTIAFDKSVFTSQKTITLTLGQLTISDRVTVAGPAAGVVVSGNNAGRVLFIDVPGSASNPVNLVNLVITNGKTAGTTAADRGGGIYIEDEAVTLTNCVVTKNTAEATGGGIYMRAANAPGDPGLLTLQDSVVSQNTSTGDPNAGFRIGTGGGVTVDLSGRVVVRRSTISGNSSAGGGGGLYFVIRGTFDIADSTISNNSALSGNGGGIYSYYPVLNNLRVVNSTISGNTALAGTGGGIYVNYLATPGPLQIANSTITGNEAAQGGGIAITYYGVANTLSLSSTIVAGNKVTNSSVDVLIDVPINVGGNNNLIGVADDGNVFYSGTGNLTGTLAVPLDAKLGPLTASNGGPTAVHRLLAGSPALNAGNNSLALNSDQRGGIFGRVSGGTADIGAVEEQPIPPPRVAQVIVNDGAAQRSIVTSLTVVFDQAVTFGSIDSAFVLARIAGGLPGLIGVWPGQFALNAVSLSFVSSALISLDPGDSLPDGVYQLTVSASQVNGANGQLDGDGNGTGGDDFTSPATGPGRITRLFGDADGDGDVDAQDFGAFRGAFGGAGLVFDFDADGDVDASDFGQFRARFGAALP